MAKDPVCGMQADEQEAVAPSAYEWTMYVFCPPGCTVAFVKAPEKYVEAETMGRYTGCA